MIPIKSEEEIETMRWGGRILAKIMKELAAIVRPGITTQELNRAAEALIFQYGATPSFKGYKDNGDEKSRPFPAALCVSVNEELVHVPPSDRILKQGDIVSLDLGIFYKGFHVDTAVSLAVGEGSPEVARLIRVTKKALKRGIKKTRPGNTIGDIGNAVQRYVEGQGFNVVRDLCGHGIGRKVHEEPKIPNYGKRGKGIEIKEGMVLCLEPMVTVGDWHLTKTADGFGYKTKDNSLCSHFEHTIAVSQKGPQVLTNL